MHAELCVSPETGKGTADLKRVTRTLNMSPILTGRSLDAPRMRDWTRRAVLCGKSIGALSHSFVSVFFNHGEHRGSQRKCARGTTAKNAKHAKVARARIDHVFSRI